MFGMRVAASMNVQRPEVLKLQRDRGPCVGCEVGRTRKKTMQGWGGQKPQASTEARVEEPPVLAEKWNFLFPFSSPCSYVSVLSLPGPYARSVVYSFSK